MPFHIILVVCPLSLPFFLTEAVAKYWNYLLCFQSPIRYALDDELTQDTIVEADILSKY